MKNYAHTTIAGLIATLALPAALMAQGQISYVGACDGSAAVLLNPDVLLSANDETNTITSYRVAGGQAIAERSLDYLLTLPDGDDEIDIEAAVRHDGRIWWIGSHGLSKKAKQRPNRRSLFATNIPEADLNDLLIVTPRMDLFEVLSTSPLTGPLFPPELLRRAPKDGGINIEGMTFDDAGLLVLGFRSPLLGDDALVVRLSLLASGPEVVSAHILHLEGRGIRDIAYHENEFFVLAGSPTKQNMAPAMYRWDGKHSPEEMNVNLDGLNPEALVRTENGWLVLSDDGKIVRPVTGSPSGEECKEMFEDDDQIQDQHSSVYFRGVLALD